MNPIQIILYNGLYVRKSDFYSSTGLNPLDCVSILGAKHTKKVLTTNEARTVFNTMFGAAKQIKFICERYKNGADLMEVPTQKGKVLKRDFYMYCGFNTKGFLSLCRANNITIRPSRYLTVADANTIIQTLQIDHKVVFQ
jgi:hypothetical protein